MLLKSAAAYGDMVSAFLNSATTRNTPEHKTPAYEVVASCQGVVKTFEDAIMVHSEDWPGYLELYNKERNEAIEFCTRNHRVDIVKFNNVILIEAALRGFALGTLAGHNQFFSIDCTEDLLPEADYDAASQNLNAIFREEDRLERAGIPFNYRAVVKGFETRILRCEMARTIQAVNNAWPDDSGSFNLEPLEVVHENAIHSSYHYVSELQKAYHYVTNVATTSSSKRAALQGMKLDYFTLNYILAAVYAFHPPDFWQDRMLKKAGML